MSRILPILLFLSTLAGSGCKTMQPSLPAPTVERDTIYVTVTDTVIRSFPLYVMDTTAALDMLREEFFFVEPDIVTKLIVEKDTVWRYRIKTQVKTDTVLLSHTDTIFQEKITQVLPTPSGKNIPWWLYVILAGVATFFGYRIRPVVDG